MCCVEQMRTVVQGWMDQNGKFSNLNVQFKIYQGLHVNLEQVRRPLVKFTHIHYVNLFVMKNMHVSSSQSMENISGLHGLLQAATFSLCKKNTNG